MTFGGFIYYCYICNIVKHQNSTIMEGLNDTSRNGMMTTRQAADYLHTSRDNLLKMVSRGQIPSYKPLGRRYFDPSELNSWMRRSK